MYQADRGRGQLCELAANADFPVNSIIRLQEENGDRRQDLAPSLHLLFDKMSQNNQLLYLNIIGYYILSHGINNSIISLK